jgi:uncharacterized protein with ATP-grasp and redox domains
MNAGLPPLLMTSEPGSFARATIVERKPRIIRQVLEDNGYPPQTVQALVALEREIALQPVQPLAHTDRDAALWNQELATYEGNTWLELPWYLAESYFYRRLLGAVQYFEPGFWLGHDPFGGQKRRQEQAAAAWLADSRGQLSGTEPEVVFEVLLHSCLWGNRADLSNFTVRAEVQGGLATRGEHHNLVIDHTEEIAARLSAGAERVAFINDNAGRELLSDLALASFLLSHGWAREIVFHLKDRPFFVSDAMPQDVIAQLSLLRAEALGQRLAEHLASGRLILKDQAFWTTCLMFDQMPPSLGTELGQSDVVMIKGDVNYRRLLGDRHWPHTARLEDIAAYFPAPLLVLRTLKGEIVVGLAPGEAQELAAQDPTWMINGKRGIIQFVSKSK